MAVDQPPVRVREFAGYLQELVSRLDQGGGWCGVFWRRDPEGMRSCLEGGEVPPWDVVESLLHDLAGVWGTRAAALEAKRAQALHGASLAAHDARPGGREELTGRLDGRLREQRYAAGRQAELRRLLESAGTREEVESLRLDLAWAEDDPRPCHGPVCGTPPADGSRRGTCPGPPGAGRTGFPPGTRAGRTAGAAGPGSGRSPGRRGHPRFRRTGRSERTGADGARP